MHAFKSRNAASYPKPARNFKTIILTGSTGSLGAYLLDTLLGDISVNRIFCLNRSKDARERQIKSHQHRGLKTNLDPSRVEFLPVDFSLPNFGLDALTVSRLASETTHILHNAWPVDFNRHVSSFEPSIRGVRNLIDFAYGCTHPASIFFISSISAVGNWTRVSGAQERVPETQHVDLRLARLGYGQSKLLSELLLSKAAKVMGLDCAVCRVGQIGGPVMHGKDGMWNKQEWVPSIIQSSKYMGVIPSTLGPMNIVDWLPVDVLGRVVIELMLQPAAERTKQGKAQGSFDMYHAVNPSHTLWSDLVPTIRSSLDGKVDEVDFVSWVSRLKESARDANASLSANPAVKLLDFFSNLQDKAIRFPSTTAASLSTTKTVQRSRTLREASPIRAETIRLWMEQWNF